MMSLVSVIIPAFNAEPTVEETLRSVLNQSHRNIEVIVVDDGSADDTAGIVRRISSHDPRVILIRQENSGVAAARNRGIDASSGAFISPIDADDLWHEKKLEMQLQKFASSSGDTALVYDFYRRIDENGFVIPGQSGGYLLEGHLFSEHLRWNFISNGSSPMVRKEVMREIGGYDTRLHASGNQGCEDYLMQLRVAMSYRIGCVPLFLTGYRKTAQSMSADIGRMVRSHVQMYELLSDVVDPDLLREIRRQRSKYTLQVARNRLYRGLMRDGLGLLLHAFALSAPSAISQMGTEAKWVLARYRNRRQPSGGGNSPRRHFFDCDPSEYES